MIQYIDKDTSVAEVVKKVFELLIDEDKVKLLLSKISNDAPKIYEGFMYNLSDLYKFVTDEYKDKIVNVVSDNIISDNLIEVKEVDLDFQRFAKEMNAVFTLPSSKTKNTEEEPLNWEYSIAKHFFELGLKAQKGE